MNQLNALFVWILKKAWSIAFVFFILWVGLLLVEKIEEFKRYGQKIDGINLLLGSVDDLAKQAVVDARARIEKLDAAAEKEIQERLNVLEQEIVELRNALPSKMDRAAAFLSGDVEKISGWTRDEVSLRAKQEESKILAQLLDYRIRLAAYERQMKDGKAELSKIRTEHLKILDDIKEMERGIEKLKKESPIVVEIPGTGPYKELKRLQNLRSEKIKQTHQLRNEYDELAKLLSTSEKPKPPETLIQSIHTEDIVTGLGAGMEELKSKVPDWVWSLLIKDDNTKVLVKSSVIIVLAATITPFGIKLFLFYVLAPVAARRQPVALLPQSNGRVFTGGNDAPSSVSTAQSSVSCQVRIDASNELLIHPEYLQSHPTDSETRTQWVLNREIPLSSLAAGLSGLTRIRVQTPQKVVVSSTRDPMSEISLVTIPQDSSVMLLPRHIVGVVQARGESMHITRHWRLASLHAWLTLQLRYLVFHGPVTLVVKGCRGVRVELAESGRSLNPSATMGFSANLQYSSRRCETLFGYLSGQQPLLNDSFSGGNGYYIYQAMPYHRKGGIFGRGIEGVFDGLLKVVGI